MDSTYFLDDNYLMMKSIAGITFIIVFILFLFNLLIDHNYNLQINSMNAPRRIITPVRMKRAKPL